MTSSISCIWCGEPISGENGVGADLPVCASCLSESDESEKGCDDAHELELETPGPHEAAPAELRTSMPRDRLLTRSMVGPPGTRLEPQATQVARGEDWIGRIEPETFRWVEISERLREFLGQASSRLMTLSLLQFLHPDDRALAAEELRQACEIGERNDLVVRMKGRSNAWHYMRLSAHARYEADGKLNHIRCNFRDVTDRVQAEHELKRRTEQLLSANEQLREANLQLKEAQAQLVYSEKVAALGTLAAGMAHEMNNPLAFAINNLALVERDLNPLFRLLALEREGEPEIAKHRPELAAAIATLADELDLAFLEENLPHLIQSTHNGLVRVARIVERLRGFAQLDRGKFSELDINESIDDCLMMLSEHLSRAGITIERRREPLPPIEASHGDLNQLLLNLLANAIAAIESAGGTDGRIIVESHRIADHVFIEISDNGIGIEPDILTRIFDPFFTTKPQGKGMGLGLSVCHGIAAQHGGRIEVESQIGEGACFRVSLPIHSELGQSASERNAVVSVGRKWSPVNAFGNGPVLNGVGPGRSPSVSRH